MFPQFILLLDPNQIKKIPTKSLMQVWKREDLHKFKAHLVHILGSRPVRATLWYSRERKEEEREERDGGEMLSRERGWGVDLGEIKNLRLSEV